MYSGKLRSFTCGILISSVAQKKGNFLTSVIQGVSRQCFQMFAIEIPISPALGKLKFAKLKIRD